MLQIFHEQAQAVPLGRGGPRLCYPKQVRVVPTISRRVQ
jgi:hypothetical protein